MATGPQYADALAPVCEIHRATMERYFRDLRDAGLIPTGNKGGRSTSVHLDQYNAVTIILGLTAPTPSGAAQAVQALQNLQGEHRRVSGGEAIGLLSELAQIIAKTACRIHEGATLEIDARMWELNVCLEPVQAFMCWTADDGTEIMEHFLDPQLNFTRSAHSQALNKGMRRHCIITRGVLNVAAELVADTFARNRSRSVAFGNAAENETAANPARNAAALDDRPDVSNPGNPHPQTTRERESSQAPFDTSAGQSPKLNAEITTYDRHRTYQPDIPAA